MKYCFFKKTVYGSFKKQKPFREIWIYSYTFQHIHAQLSISIHIHRYIQNPLQSLYIRSLGIFSTRSIFSVVVYSEPSYNQSLEIFRTRLYSEPWYIQYPVIFRTLPNIYDGVFSRKQLTDIIIFITSAVQVPYFMKKQTFFNAGLYCIPEVFILCKVRDREFMNREFIQINQHIWS